MLRSHIDHATSLLEEATACDGTSYALPASDRESLYAEARQIRDTLFGPHLYLRASLEFSNHCAFTCGFCGMSRTNLLLERYRISRTQAVDVVQSAADAGVQQLHLVSGEGFPDDVDTALALISLATDRGMGVTLVMGTRKYDDYRRMFDAGADRYIIKFETSDPNLFRRVKGGMDLSRRIAQLFLLREIGFKIGTGIIVGLPGYSLDILRNDIRLIDAIAPDMASASVFTPNSDSAFAAASPGDSLLALDIVATMRVMFRERVKYISSSTSLPNHAALRAGANVASVHVTPEGLADNFSMYRASDRIISNLESMQRSAADHGLTIASYE